MFGIDMGLGNEKSEGRGGVIIIQNESNRLFKVVSNEIL